MSDSLRVADKPENNQLAIKDLSPRIRGVIVVRPAGMVGYALVHGARAEQTVATSLSVLQEANIAPRTITRSKSTVDLPALSA